MLCYKKAILPIIASVLLSSTALAADLEMCTTLFSKGIIDEHNTYRIEDRYSQARTLLEKQDFKSYSEMTAWAAKVGLSIPVLEDLIGIDAEAKSNTSKFQQQYSNFKSETDTKAKERLAFTDLDSRISQTLLAVYQDCERNYFNTVLSNVRQIVTATPQNPPDHFNLRVSVSFPAGVNQHGLEVKSIEPGDLVKCSENGKAIKFPFNSESNEALLNCTKPLTKDVQVQINTNAGVTQSSILIPKERSEIDSLRGALAAIKARLATSSVPIGTIVAYSGSMYEAEGMRSQGWWICDGRPVNDPQSSYNAKNTPNLQSKFIMGSTTPGQSGGQASYIIPDQTIDSHTTGGFGPPIIHGDPFTHMQGAHAWTTDASIYSQGAWKGREIPTTPPYYSVIYLLKVR